MINTLPLAGIRVVDLSRVLAGPLCAMVLGDLGADVIKVERPPSGDDTRGWGPPFDAAGLSAYFLSVNRNKLAITADLAAPHDRDVVMALIRDADIVIENYLPGALARLGIDAARALQENSRLVWCTITGFGADSVRPGYDFVVQAETGWMAVTGEPDGVPMKAGVAIADLLAGRDAAIAVLAALIARTSPGASRHVGVSLAHSARAALVNVAQNALVTGADARRWGNAHPNLVPYQLFAAADRDIVIAVGSDAQWVSCARVLGLDDLASDPALATNAGRIAHRERIVSRIAEVVARASATDWVARLDRAGVPCGVVKTVLEAVREAAGASALDGMPSAVGGRVRLSPPRLGEHAEVVRRLGWGAFEAVTPRGHSSS